MLRESMGLIAHVLEEFLCGRIGRQLQRGITAVYEDYFFLLCNGGKMGQRGLHPAKRFFCRVEMA